MDKGKLYLVSTPIGNMGDITFRAVEVLKSADAVLAEDTRVTGKLLKHLDIKKPLISYHEHTNGKRRENVLQRLSQGETLALCSDAGMPCISDPGQQLVKDALANGVEVVPIPGANAMLTALIASGVSTDSFAFMGFFPRKKRTEALTEVMNLPLTLVYYESPMRIIEALEAVCEVMPNRQTVVARELTKLHEEFIRGTADEVLSALKNKDAVKGEIVLIIAPGETDKTTLTNEEIEDMLKTQLNTGKSLKSAVKTVCDNTGLGKNRVYAIGKELKEC